MAKNELASAAFISQITAESQSLAFIEYFLRLNLQATTSRILSAWEISNPQLTLQFEKRTKGLLVLDAWVDLQSMGDENGEEQVVERGFLMSGSNPASGSSGLKFTVGKIQQLPEDTKVITKRMMLCKIGVGRAYNATEDFARLANVPEGYDTFVIDRDKTNNLSNTNLGYDYIVKDAAQILPTFIVVFEYDPVAEKKSRQKVLCENCEGSPATVFCQADAANLCTVCDNNMHSSKLASRHIRLPLDSGPQTFSCCKSHPDKIVEFFCPTCSRPVCVTCKMIGHHAVGDAARHKLVTVAEAFKSVSDAASAVDPILDSRRQTIQSQIRAVEDRAAQVESNAAEMQKQLEELFRKAQADLKALTKKKLNILKGDVVELSRQEAAINSLESFLKYQQSGGNATQFILDWTHHQRLRAELHGFAHFRESIDVHPDLRVSGAIQIVVEGCNSHNSSNLAGEYTTLSDKPRYASSRSTRVLPSFDHLSIRPHNRKPSDIIEIGNPAASALGFSDKAIKN